MNAIQTNQKKSDEAVAKMPPALATLFSARTQCSHYDDWRKEETRCQNTSEDGLPYYETNGARYCAVHGPLHKFAVKKG